MFGRLQRWIRGRKKNVSISKPKAKPKKDKLKKSKSLFDIDTTAERDNDDGFKRNNIDDFDIVLTAEAHRHSSNFEDLVPDAATSSNASSPTKPTSDGSNFSKTEQVDKVKIVSPEKKNESTAATENKSIHPESENSESPEGSVVDLIAPPTTNGKVIRNENPNLSFDEKETLDMFDSIVNDFEIEDDNDIPPEINSTKEDEMSQSIEKSRSDDEPSEAAIENAVSRAKSPINFDQILGENHEEVANKSSNISNWRISSEQEQIHKSFRFVNGTGMYLPSTAEKGAPELPPTDYPHTDDELEKDLNDKEQVSALQDDIDVVTSFSSNSVSSSAKPEQRANGTSHVGNGVEHKAPKFHLNGSSATNGNSESPTVIESNERATSPHPRAAPKRPKPRITSFKAACRTPTPEMSSKPVTSLVKKFENF